MAATSNYHDDSTPAVCDTCLGSNPYVEMKRQVHGAECKICSKPFTVFKWMAEYTSVDDKTGKVHIDKSLKKTVICLTCARAKNRCQSCLLDLTFGIPIEMRDKLLKIAKIDDPNPSDVVSNAKNITSRIYNSNLLEEKFKNEEINDHLIDNDDLKSKLQSNLKSVIQHSKQNQKSDTKSRSTSLVSKQDLVKLLKAFPLNGNLQQTPKNSNIKSFFFFGNLSNLSNYQIKDYFLDISPSLTKDDISSLYIQTKGNFGYVEFKSRQIAQNIAKLIYNQQLNSLNCESYKSPCLVIISKVPIRFSWAMKSDMSATNYKNDELEKISSVVNKQLIKLAKFDSSLTSNEKVAKSSKIEKP